MGDRGSMLVELAASWTIIMIITGLYLWWPRQAKGDGRHLVSTPRHGIANFLARYSQRHGNLDLWPRLSSCCSAACQGPSHGVTI